MIPIHITASLNYNDITLAMGILWNFMELVFNLTKIVVGKYPN